jgi:hypothetical protein
MFIKFEEITVHKLQFHNLHNINFAVKNNLIKHKKAMLSQLKNKFESIFGRFWCLIVFVVGCLSNVECVNNQIIFQGLYCNCFLENYFILKCSYLTNFPEFEIQQEFKKYTKCMKRHLN